MHYTAMAGTIFVFVAASPNVAHAVDISTLGILGSTIVPVLVLVAALLTALTDRLRKQRAHLDELFERAPEAVALMTADNRIIRVNRQFTQLFGYSPQETVGLRLRDLIVPDEYRAEAQRIAELSARGERVDIESVRRRKDGGRFPVAIVHVPVSVPGAQMEIYALYRDITEHRQALKAVRESAKRLQSLSRRLLEVQEAERIHLARELHDEIGQILTGLRLMLRPTGDTSPEAVKNKLEQARAIVDDLLAKVRGLSFELRPAALDELGLVPALLTLFERYTTQTGLRVDFKHHGMERRFAPEVETAAYRLVQEALTNVARHAGVAAASVRLWATPETLSLQIEDQGSGFDAEAALATLRSGGLTGMRERVVLLGGHIVIESHPGKGTEITIELPLADGAHGGKP
jgi:PAS domain S-box-containing protein